MINNINSCIIDIILKNIDGDLELNKGTFEMILCESEKSMRHHMDNIAYGRRFKSGHLDWNLYIQFYRGSNITYINLELMDMPKDWKSVEFKVTIFVKGTNKNKTYDKLICYDDDVFPDSVHYLLYLTNEEVLYLYIKSVF